MDNRIAEAREMEHTFGLLYVETKRTHGLFHPQTTAIYEQYVEARERRMYLQQIMNKWAI